MNKKDITISLAKFLSRYMLMQGEGLKTLTHKDIKEQFPNIKRCSLKDAKLLYIEGKVVYVSDGKCTLPYLIPDKMQSTIHYTEISKLKEKQKQKTETDFCKMNIYELLCLLNTRMNRKSTARKAREEQNERGYTLKRTYKVQRDKEIIKAKEADFIE